MSEANDEKDAAPQLQLKKGVDSLAISPDKHKVLMRVDFNVPIKDGVIQNDYRIRSVLPTLSSILKRGGSAILMSHLGRPKPDVVYTGDEEGRSLYSVEEFSLAPVATRLQELLQQQEGASDKPVLFASDCLNAQDLVDQLEPGQVLLLENLRFYKNEGSKKESERIAMATKLASYADLYVSDAFGTAHRDSASMTGVPKVMGQGAAGYLMGKEIAAFSQILGDAVPRPFVAVVGGAKVSDKILLLENLMERVNKLIIGGAMAYTFLKAQGHDIGKSFSEAGKTSIDKDGKEVDTLVLARNLLEKASSKGIEVFLPVDHACNTEFANTDSPLITSGVDIPEDSMALDIGPQTISKYVEAIGQCATVIFNGPMGVFEMKAFSPGTFAVTKAMADGTEERGLVSIIGGGDSASAAELSGDAKRMTHVSTGGGASLELLEGKTLPGIAALDDA